VLAQDSATGRRFESLPADVVNCMRKNTTVANTPVPYVNSYFNVYSDRPVTLRRPTTGGLINAPPGWATCKSIAFNFYRGRGELYGFIGQATDRDFTDVGQEPDYAKQPPKGEHPFKVLNDAGAVVRTETPRSVAFFQERRVFGGTGQRPSFLWASATGNYYNFDQYTLAPVDASLSFDLLTRRREDIRSLLVSHRLLVFTNSSVWSVAGHQGQALTADSVDARVVEEIGASHLQPIIVDGTALYVREKGLGVRALVPSDTLSGFSGSDISVISRHLFLGETRTTTEWTNFSTKNVVDWSYAEDPWGIVWCVRGDGVLLSLTFSRAQQMWAWARHDTDGFYKNVCAVPETTEDGVYVAVQRTINSVTRTFIERMTSRVRQNNPYDDNCLDCSVVYVGPPTTTITGLSHLEGKQVWATAYNTAPMGPFTVTFGSITLPEAPAAYFTLAGTPFVVIQVGLKFTPDIETLDLAESSVRTRQKTVSSISFEVTESRGLSVGQDFDHLVDWPQRQVTDSYGAVSSASALVKVPVLGTWDMAARAALRQNSPLPVTVLGISREVDIGGT
jgi:hypothetical protein